MADVTIHAVGRLKEPHYSAACDEYLKRLKAFGRVQVIETRETQLSRAPSPAEIAGAVAEECGRVILPPRAYVVALTPEGRTLDSEGFAGLFKTQMDRGVSSFAFVIGGSFGLSDAMKQRADLRLSMSAMTFPHHLARVMLLEQIYRASQILSGGKYHK
ncbi:23S rRNA (pseudouridine(1915)-N(3))-methyltransferase RlmH [Oscillospiraceae bacterium OttesenSCG-928-F05]|nr:23S rRNA (pseudouridine(1915)-N(3))-methyltransferase RlmH [Oscillospiraceae bacterium OttesenSCG-928-F05]